MKMKNNANIIWVAVVFLAIGLIAGFLIASGVNKTGDAVRGIQEKENLFSEYSNVLGGKISLDGYTFIINEAYTFEQKDNKLIINATNPTDRKWDVHLSCECNQSQQGCGGSVVGQTATCSGMNGCCGWAYFLAPLT
jgi:hypothetical protein